MTATAPARIGPTETDLLEAMAIAKNIAGHMSLRTNNCDAEELTSIGYLAVAEAFRRFEPKRGVWLARVKFLVRNRIRDHFRKIDIMSRGARKKVGMTPGVLSLNGLVESGFQFGVYDRELSRTECMIVIQRLMTLAGISPRSRFIIRAHYLGGETLASVADGMGISESLASALRIEAIRQMRDAPRREQQYDRLFKRIS